MHVDETGWRTAGDARALWTLTTPGAALFEIAEHCNREQFEALIGAYPGIMVSDRWNGYEHLDPHRRQVCWSHIQRDFRRHSRRPRPSRRPSVSKASSSPAACLTPGAPTSTNTTTASGSRPRSRRSRPSYARCSRTPRPKSRRTRWHRRFANNLLKIWPALWTFATVDGVEPTNNPAERALRGPVIHRKLSHGTRSTSGERFAERAQSAATTCRLQRRSLFAYLRELLIAHTRGDPFPALT